MDVLILIITCVVNLVLGLFVVFRDARRVYARLFVSVSVLLTVWIITNFFTNHNILGPVWVDLCNKLAFVSGYGVLLSGLLFTYTFPVRKNLGKKEMSIIGATSFIVVSLSMTELIAGSVSFDAAGRPIFSNGPLTWVYIVGFAVAIGMMARNLLGVTRKNHGDLKARQARFILLAFAGTAVLGLILNVILPLIVNSWDSTRYGPLVTVLLVATIAYAIVKHGLFDIRAAAVRGVAYTFSLITLAALYYAAAYTLSWTLVQGRDDDIISHSPLSIGLALVLAFVFQPVKRFFDKLTNQVFFHDEYNTDDFLERLGRELSATSDLRNLLQRASREISNTIKAEFGAFFVRYGEGARMNAGAGKYTPLQSREVAMLDEYIHRQKEGNSLVIVDSLPDSEEVRDMLTERGVALVLPLVRDDEQPNYLLIGRRRSRQYTSRDVRVLETIANELIIAIQNAFSVQEVKDVNANLQGRIEDATAQLRKKNAELRKLDATKDEFVSMASHQLRTPLTSVKGYISMVLEGDAGKLTKMQRQLLGEAFTSSERMVHLISDFLNVSRLQTGKFLIEARQIDLSKVVAQEVESLQTTAKAHNMKLLYRMPSHFPLLYVDEGKIRQVIMNFIDNAIYYSKEHTTITVKVYLEGPDAVVTVHDTGIGVPKAEQAHLFTKFFRASNARKQRPDGTGVGLFLAKKVVTAHGGSMIFESHQGEGSTFGFRLPVKRLSNAPANDAEKFDE